MNASTGKATWVCVMAHPRVLPWHCCAGLAPSILALTHTLPPPPCAPCAPCAPHHRHFHRLCQNKKGVAPKQDIKEASKKAKRARYNLAAQKSAAGVIADKEQAAGGWSNLATVAVTAAPPAKRPASAPGAPNGRPAGASVGVRAGAGTGAAPGAVGGKGGKAAGGVGGSAGAGAGAGAGAAAPGLKALLPTVEDSLSFGAVKARVGFVKQTSKLTVGGVPMVVEPTASASLAGRIMGTAAPGGVVAPGAAAAAAAAGAPLKPKKVSLAKLLANAEKSQARLDELRQKKELVDVGPGQAAVDELWGPALARAAGEKIRDDPALIRKTLRRVKQKKAKSARDWCVGVHPPVKGGRVGGGLGGGLGCVSAWHSGVPG
jgi:hypothetical protein